MSFTAARITRRQLGMTTSTGLAAAVLGTDLLSPQVATAAPSGGQGSRSQAPSAPPLAVALLAGPLRPVPDPSPTTGSWRREPDGRWQGRAGNAIAVAVSEQWTGPLSRFTTTVTPPTHGHTSAGLLLRGDQDGMRGCAAVVDTQRHQLRLVDLRSGLDMAAPARLGRPRAGTYSLEVVTDGPVLRVTSGPAVLQVTDSRYAEGHVGLVVLNGAATLQAPRCNVVGTNLWGWRTTGSASWRADGTGLHVDGVNTPTVLVAGNVAADTVVTSLVRLDAPDSVASVIVRSDTSGANGYAAQVDGRAQELRLVRLDDSAVLARQAVSLEQGKVYRATMRAVGSQLSLAWQTDFLDSNGVRPVLEAVDETHTRGHVGLGVQAGSVTFQSTTLLGPVSTTFWSATPRSQVSPDPRGLAIRGSAVSEVIGRDVVVALDADLSRASEFSVAVRCTVGTTGPRPPRGIVVSFHDTGTATVTDGGTGRLLTSAAIALEMFERTTHVEVSVVGNHLSVSADGSHLMSAALPRASRRTRGSQGDRVVLSGDEVVAQNIRAELASTSYNGLHQPRYHYSQAASNTSDPNGLVFFEGEYHLFHQDRGRWAHAISTDLLHWTPMPIAIDATRFGDSWSGCAVADHDNRSGLFPSGAGLIAFFTSYDQDEWNGAQTVRAAISSDRGRSWTVLDRVVVPNPGPDGKWDFRDPKVTWDPDHDNYVMVVSGGDHIRIFTSTDLLIWAPQESFGYGDWRNGGVWECPDLFQLPIAGSEQKRWVMWWSTGAVRETNGSNARYVTGVWDGHRFTADTAPSEVLRSDLGRDYYAAMTFSDLPGGRRVQLAWMSNWDYAFAEPTGRFSGALSLPRELGLVDQPGVGVRLTQLPVNVTSLVQQSFSVGNVRMQDGTAFTRHGLHAYRLRLEVSIPLSGGAESVRIDLRRGGDHATTLTWSDEVLRLDRSRSGSVDFSEHFSGYNDAIWPSRVVDGQRRVQLDVFVDSSSVEVFRTDGLGSMTCEVFPEPEWQDLLITAHGGLATIVSATIDTLDAGYAVAPGLPLRPYRDWAGDFRASWGEMVAGQGIWTRQGAGLTGTYDRDALQLSVAERSDVVLEADVRMGSSPWRGQMLGREPWPLRGQGAALSFVLRSDAERRNGYMLNLDPQLHVARVFRITDGAFDTIASRDMTLVAGTTYRVKVSAIGTRLSLEVDGVEAVAATDDRFHSGHYGVDVFGGRASLQDAGLA